MQIPLSYAEDIIGIQGTNIDYIRRTSGAILTVQESRVPDEIVVEIKGTSSQVQTAQQLIQVGDFRWSFPLYNYLFYICMLNTWTKLSLFKMNEVIISINAWE